MQAALIHLIVRVEEIIFSIHFNSSQKSDIALYHTIQNICLTQCVYHMCKVSNRYIVYGEMIVRHLFHSNTSVTTHNIYETYNTIN